MRGSGAWNRQITIRSLLPGLSVNPENAADVFEKQK